MKSTTNIAFSLTNLLASMISSFLLVPLFTSTMSVEAYGYVGLGQAFISIAMVFSIAITSLSTRYIVVAYHQDKQKAQAYFNSMLAACVVLTCIIAACFLLLMLNIEHVMQISPEYVADARSMIAFMSGSFCLNILACPFLSGQYYRGDLRAYYSFSAMSQLARIALPLVLFDIVGPSLWLPYASSFAVDFVAFLFYIVIFRRFLPGVAVKRKSISKRLIKEVLAVGVWSSVNKAGAIMLSTVPRYMANILLGTVKAGYYSTFAQFQTLFASFTTAVVGALVPNLINIYAKKNHSDFQRLFIRYVKYLAIVLGALCGIALVYIKPFFELWVGSEATIYEHVIALMIVFLPLVYPAEVLNQVLIIETRVKIPAIVTLGSGMANLALTILFCSVLKLDILGLVLAQIIVLILRSWVFLSIYTAAKSKPVTFGILGNTLYGPLTLVLSLAASFGVSCLAPAVTNWALLFFDCLLCLVPVGIISIILLGREDRHHFISLCSSLINKKD